MLRIYLIRHLMTEGNKRKCYIGSTDEPLCQEGIDALNNRQYPEVQYVFTSPMLRCQQTAGLLYPGHELVVVDDFRECDFGDFEGKNYQDLADDRAYQEWIDTGGTLPFPGGESREDFERRCGAGFELMVMSCLSKNITKAAVVVHGGTIMSILDKYAEPHQDYYEWQLENGEGYDTSLQDGVLKVNGKLSIMITGDKA